MFRILDDSFKRIFFVWAFKPKSVYTALVRCGLDDKHLAREKKKVVEDGLEWRKWSFLTRPL